MVVVGLFLVVVGRGRFTVGGGGWWDKFIQRFF